MRVFTHPAVLAVVLAGLVLRAWDLVDVVTTTQWLIWAGVSVLVVALVARGKQR